MKTVWARVGFAQPAWPEGKPEQLRLFATERLARAGAALSDQIVPIIVEGSGNTRAADPEIEASVEELESMVAWASLWEAERLSDGKDARWAQAMMTLLRREIERRG